MTGMITFHGPTLLPSFGPFEGIDSSTKQSLIKAIQTSEPIGDLASASKYSDESLFWDKEDIRPSTYKPAVPYSVLHESGIVEGTLFGGNINTLGMLIGTKYLPNLKNSILFLEDGDTNLARVERDLQYLDQSNIFSQLKGVLVGRFIGSENSKSKIFDFFKLIGRKYDIPIIINLDIGHTKPILTLPIGGRIKIDSINGIVTVVDSAVI